MVRSKVLTGKTARFAQVVARCGRPAVQLTLTDPRKDRPLSSLAARGRVMTLHRAHRGEGADYGVTGLDVSAGAQYLVFPHSLKPFLGRRIIGIDYDLLNEPTMAAAHRWSGASRKAPAAPPPDTPGRLRHPASAYAPPEKEASSLPVVPAPTTREILHEVDVIARQLRGRRFRDAAQNLAKLRAWIGTTAELEPRR